MQSIKVEYAIALAVLRILKKFLTQICLECLVFTIIIWAKKVFSLDMARRVLQICFVQTIS